MNNSMDIDDEFPGYAPGDRVRLIQNHLLTGQVIGERNWGEQYLVRVGPSITTLWFNECELEPDTEFTPNGGICAPASNTVAQVKPCNDNVIPLGKTTRHDAHDGANHE